VKPGPRLGALQQGRSYAEKAADAWGELPDWVAELATHADQHGAKASALAIGYSGSAVSMVLNKGSSFDKLDLGRFEQAVRGGLMGLTVTCLAQGDIGRDVCLSNQRLPFSAHRRERVVLYHACRSGCPHFLQKGNSNGTE
jgi:hypothetical protein